MDIPLVLSDESTDRMLSYYNIISRPLRLSHHAKITVHLPVHHHLHPIHLLKPKLPIQRDARRRRFQICLTFLLVRLV